MKPFLKKYLVPLILGAGSLLLFPFSSFIILIGGDSCCGENTTGNMLTVAIILSVLYAIAISLLLVIYYLIAKFALKHEITLGTVLVGFMIGILPAITMNMLLWAIISISAFGFSEFLNPSSWL